MVLVFWCWVLATLFERFPREARQPVTRSRRRMHEQSPKNSKGNPPNPLGSCQPSPHQESTSHIWSWHLLAGSAEKPNTKFQLYLHTRGGEGGVPLHVKIARRLPFRRLVRSGLLLLLHENHLPSISHPPP